MLNLLLWAAVAGGPDSLLLYRGRAHRLDVQVPRLEATVVVDGRLDEGVWEQAARLVDFSQYQPVDGMAAVDATDILVWYGADAIYFGVRASEAHGNVIRATKANRDNISSEDHVQILLDTYNDRRLAFLFGVNPLGVQQDGTRSDNFGGGAGGRSSSNGGFGNINPLDGTVDLNPDFAFESKGRLTEGGYEVEIRIPFKSLRYQEGATQTWGINVLRRIQHSGVQDVWTPAVRANASFLSQSGSLVGLHDLKRGLVLDVTPTTTGKLDGGPGNAGRWHYSRAGDFGADLHWGISQNLTLNGTVNPDFSQVEADVGQVTLNERFALFYPEKRPFFLDGLELFDTPNQLIYTRRIANPDAGVKVAGKVGGLNVASLLAADGEDASATGHTPVFGAARLRTDLGRNSTLGSVLTAREDGSDYSRLIGGDFRLYHNKLYFIELQAVQSWSASNGSSRSGPLFQAAWDRTGRAWGFHYDVKAVAPDFQAAAGFVNRTGVIEADAFNRVSFYGKPDGLFQTYGAFIGVTRFWTFDHPESGTIEGSESIFPSATLRGGWQLGGSVGRSYYSYDPAAYTGYTVRTPGGGATAFTVPSREDDQFSWSARITTPTYRFFTLSASASGGDTPIFREAAPGSSRRLDLTLDLRPTASLRAALQMTRLAIDRQRDGSRYSTESIPRLKVEYQLSRSVFVRFIGQYSARERTAGVDRTGRPILVNGTLDQADRSNEFRMDWLFSYRPTPGTLFYLGYGSTMQEPDRFRFGSLHRQADGFFGKLSYLFRL